MLTIDKNESHTDHGLTEDQMNYVLGRFSDRDGFFITTITLPEDLGTVPCGLYGPSMGDEPVTDEEVEYGVRVIDIKYPRRWTSRMCSRPKRQVHELTIIAGPTKDGHPCGLYTVYGGPPAPRDPGDDSIDTMEGIIEAREFWKVHALSV